MGMWWFSRRRRKNFLNSKEIFIQNMWNTRGRYKKLLLSLLWRDEKIKTLGSSCWYTSWEPCCSQTHHVSFLIKLLTTWNIYLRRWLMEDVLQKAAKVQSRCFGKKNNVGYLRGCDVILNIWFYKVISTRKKLLFGRTLRILCYRENSFKKQVSLGPLLSTLDGKRY